MGLIEWEGMGLIKWQGTGLIEWVRVILADREGMNLIDWYWDGGSFFSEPISSKRTGLTQPGSERVSER